MNKYSKEYLDGYFHGRKNAEILTKHIWRAFSCNCIDKKMHQKYQEELCEHIDNKYQKCNYEGCPIKNELD